MLKRHNLILAKRLLLKYPLNALFYNYCCEAFFVKSLVYASCHPLLLAL